MKKRDKKKQDKLQERTKKRALYEKTRKQKYAVAKEKLREKKNLPKVQ